jgi:tellurite resistance-related uncharacterized protein
VSAPYKSTPVFDAQTLPQGLRRVHSTKEGTWGRIRILEGRLRLSFPDTGREEMLTPERPGLVRPNEPHLLAPLGPFRMQVDFYRAPPTADAGERSNLPVEHQRRPGPARAD